MVEEFEKPKKPSRLWYLLPISLGILGGVIGYFLLRKRDRKFAEKLLIIGLLMIFVWWGIKLLIGLLISMLLINMYVSAHTSNVFETRIASPIELIESHCYNGIATLIVRNDGIKDLTSSSLTCTAESNPCSGTCSPVDLPAGQTGTITISGCSSGYHTYRLAGPSNSINMVFYCP